MLIRAGGYLDFDRWRCDRVGERFTVVLQQLVVVSVDEVDRGVSCTSADLGDGGNGSGWRGGRFCAGWELFVMLNEANVE